MDRSTLAERLRAFGTAVSAVGSPLYGTLLSGAAEDCERGGPVWFVLEAQRDEPIGSALPLRLMGGLHHFVLQGRAPELERYFRVDGEDPATAWPHARALLEDNETEFRAFVARPCQTNEVARSALLAPGFAMIAGEMRMPLRLLEVGSSGGLNLRWDRYRYEGRRWLYGPQNARVRFADMFEGAEPQHDGHVVVAERTGCDPNPVDPATEEGRLTLMSYTWPDQPGRLDRLRAALDVALEVPAKVEKAGAVEWLPARIAEPRDEVVTVIFHSVVMQYIDARDDFVALITDAGERVTPHAPLAWLRFEPEHLDTGAGPFRLRLTLWPDGTERTLAEAHPHGPPIHWLADE